VTTPPMSWEDYFDWEVRHNQYFPTPDDYQQYLNHHKEQHA